MTHRTAEDDDGLTASGPDPAGDLRLDVRALVRLLRAVQEAEANAGSERLTNEAAVDALARKIVAAAAGPEPGTRTALMALRDLVWRVDTARVLIEPRLEAAGFRELADLLATDDIHALLRDLS